MTVSARRARALYLAPWGFYSRYMLSGYLRHVFTVAAALMTIALTIDLWPQIPLLTATPGMGMAGVVWQIIRLAVLRIPDLMSPFIPFATFLGVVWSEIVFTESRERMLIWNSGRSPLQCLVPALMVGLLMGVGLLVLDGYLRPVAISVQIAERFGREGIRLDRNRSAGNHWIALPNGLVRGEIEYGPPPRLHNVTLYRMDAQGHLAEVDSAELATPLATDGQWRLERGHYWKASGADTALSTGNIREENETPFQERIVPIKLDLMWLGNLGMSPQYIHLGDLRRLARAQILAPDAAGFATRLQALYGEGLLTCAMAILAASLSMLYFAFRTRVTALVLVLLAGYLAHFSVRAFLLMGEFGYVGPFVAGWLMPLVIMLGTGAVLYVIQKRRGLGARLSLNDTPVLGEAG